jgi:hypothetical protein
LIIGLAAAFSSPISQHQIGFSTPGSDSQRINQLWLVAYLNEAGLEVVAQAKQTSGNYAWLIAADQSQFFAFALLGKR